MGFRSPAYLLLVPSALFGCAAIACAQQFPFRNGDTGLDILVAHTWTSYEAATCPLPMRCM
ncbi:MAG: hypothetical protein JNM84_04965 [Planctomycetes bacterium]|nr:hypothetical protein [Planctomycetota bacterium]